ncbi:hypothetical protein Nepgr_026016 [Nepenthes gracilis]|uniref:Uncharacterized protein n=1 Tax=Nepenthes gracilis TaxID=150966 RepID=A0AAD3T7A7_NEPGR|nr:hypothetical protein Nepgr_026016 [Nepenthes gracilis]
MIKNFLFEILGRYSPAPDASFLARSKAKKLLGSRKCESAAKKLLSTSPSVPDYSIALPDAVENRVAKSSKVLSSKHAVQASGAVGGGNFSKDSPNVSLLAEANQSHPANAEPMASVAECYVDLEEFSKERDLDAKVQHGSRSVLDESTPGGLGMTSHDVKTDVVQAGAALDSTDVLSKNVGGSHCSLEDYVGTNLGLDTASGPMDHIEGSQDVEVRSLKLATGYPCINGLTACCHEVSWSFVTAEARVQPIDGCYWRGSWFHFWSMVYAMQMAFEYAVALPTLALGGLLWRWCTISPAVVMGWDTVVATLLFVLPVLCFNMAEADCWHMALPW